MYTALSIAVIRLRLLSLHANAAISLVYCIYNCDFSVCSLFPAESFLTENAEVYYEIYCVILPICTVATAVIATCKCSGRGLDVIRIPSPSFFLTF
jgi:hypothetical protein